MAVHDRARCSSCAAVEPSEARREHSGCRPSLTRVAGQYGTRGRNVSARWETLGAWRASLGHGAAASRRRSHRKSPGPITATPVQLPSSATTCSSGSDQPTLTGGIIERLIDLLVLHEARVSSRREEGLGQRGEHRGRARGRWHPGQLTEPRLRLARERRTELDDRLRARRRFSARSPRGARAPAEATSIRCSST